MTVQAAPVPAKPVVAPKTILPVYGKMINPFTNIVYDNGFPMPCPDKIEDGSWLDCQIKAGKLKIS